MNYHQIFITIILLLSPYSLISQDTIPEFSSIELIDGNIVEGFLSYDQICSAFGNDDKVNLYEDDKLKKFKGYPLNEISKLKMVPNKQILIEFEKLKSKNPDVEYDKANLVMNFEILYDADRDKRFVGKVLYKGEKYKFYHYFRIDISGQQPGNGKVIITKAKNNTMIHRYPYAHVDKYNVRQLKKYFKFCPEFDNVASQKKHDSYFYFKLTDECGD